MKIKTLAALLFSALLSASCKKEKVPGNEETIVYVAGAQRDSAAGNDVSGIWKNGTFMPNTLPGSNNHYANALFVKGTDVFTTGFENRPSQWKCHVWKNGQHQYGLDDTYSYGNAIAVTGADIYIGGGRYEAATHGAAIWKNQDLSAVLGISNSEARVLGSCVMGNDVYMVGNIGNAGKLWKNGVEVAMANTTGANFKAVTVIGTDVYITANVGVRTIRYWKNSNYTDITVGAGREIFVSGIAVENNDVYVSGWESTGSVLIAKYWKNGTEVVLGDGIKNSYTGGIAVKDGKVYVVGNLAAGSVALLYYATIWQDGVAKVIGARNSQATAVVVK